MKAVIMAGGEGTRLRPLTCQRPKPMVSVANKPVMQHIIELLKKHSITDIAVTLQYMPQLIKDCFGNGNELDVNIKYFEEITPLGTAGSVKNAEDFLDSTFVVISGDALTDIDLSSAIKFHKEKNSLVTLVLKKVDIPLEYGVVVTDEQGKIKKFLEKPSWSEVFSDTANTGIYILEPEIFTYYDKDKFYDFSRDLFPLLLREGRPMYGYVTEDYWCDIGDLRAYTQANLDVLNGLVNVDIPYNEVFPKVWIGKDVILEDGCDIEAPCIIGNNSIVKSGVKVQSGAVIGDSVQIGRNATIKKSVVLKNTNISNHVQLRGVVLCEKVYIHEGCNLFESSVVGDNTILRKNVTIKPGVKIWPDKSIDEGIEITSSIVWGTRSIRNIFGARGITGELNVDITCEFASKMASSFATACIESNKGRNIKLGVSYDGISTSYMLKSATLAGLMSIGIEIVDLDEQTLPIVRYAVKNMSLDGAIFISSLLQEDNKRVRIEFLNNKGLNIDKGFERKIENIYIREDYQRNNEMHSPKQVIKNTLENDYVSSLFEEFAIRVSKCNFIMGTNSKNIHRILNKLQNNFSTSVPMKYKDGSINELLVSTKKIVINEKLDMGVIVHENGEKIILIDKDGNIIEEDRVNLLIFSLMLKNINNVAVPITASSTLDKIAHEYNHTILRTKTSASDIMKTIYTDKNESAAIRQLSFQYDGFYKLLAVVEATNSEIAGLLGLIDKLPKLHMTKKEVYCPWNLKGKVIRELISQKEALDNEEQGVRLIGDKGWVLVLPDDEKPVCNIISEAVTTEFANELCDIYEQKVRKIGSTKD